MFQRSVGIFLNPDPDTTLNIKKTLDLKEGCIFPKKLTPLGGERGEGRYPAWLVILARYFNTGSNEHRRKKA